MIYTCVSSIPGGSMCNVDIFPSDKSIFCNWIYVHFISICQLWRKEKKKKFYPCGKLNYRPTVLNEENRFNRRKVQIMHINVIFNCSFNLIFCQAHFSWQFENKSFHFHKIIVITRLKPITDFFPFTYSMHFFKHCSDLINSSSIHSHAMISL